MNRAIPLSMLAASLAFGQEIRLGSKVPDFNVQDLQSNRVAFSSLKGDTTVVVFVSTQCPISNDYNERMNTLFEEYSKKGVKFLFLNANANEPAAEVASHARSSGFTFPVYKDAGNIVADRFGAQVTPETYLIDRTGVLRFHGAIDDSRNPARIQVQGLRKALDEMLAGRPVSTAETKAFGCTIKRVRGTS